MKIALQTTLLIMSLGLSGLTQAAPLVTPVFTLNAPDDIEPLERKESIDEETGKPGGILVFTKANDMPRAVFILTYTYAAPKGAPFDPLDAAVKIGNPYDTSLTAKDATSVTVGGMPGGRYEGRMGNGMRVVSYVTEKDGYRLVVLFKGPAKKPYTKLTDEFAKAVESLSWTVPAAETAAAATPVAAPAATPAAVSTK